MDALRQEFEEKRREDQHAFERPPHFSAGDGGDKLET